MTEDRPRSRQSTASLWKAPAYAWLALLALFAIALGSAYVPLGAGNVAVNLLIAAAMVAIVVTFLMDLQHSKPLLRIAAGAGLFWLVLMFTLTFCDYLARPY